MVKTKKLKLAPSDFKIPPDNPFQNDLLDRGRLAEILMELVAGNDGPYVVAIDGDWGAGKSTFIKMWTQELRRKDLPIVEFNAWENDFSGDALVALSSELTSAIRKYEPQVGKVDEIITIVKKIAANTSVAAIKIKTCGLLDLNALMKKGDLFSGYEDSKELNEKFKSNLADVATKLEQKTKHPLVVVIDELDRCRPLYAIEVLEAAKHLFSVGSIVFVLAVNLRELAHSIRAIYGSDFSSYDYLERFIDLTIPLPKAERVAYIRDLMSEKTRNVISVKDQYSEIAEFMIMNILGSPDLNLRRVEHYIKRLNILLTSVSNEPGVVLPVVVALIARAYDSEKCFKFYQGEITDKEFVDSLIKKIGIKRLNQDVEGAYLAFVLISAQLAIEGADPLNENRLGQSRLWNRYESIEANATVAEPDERVYARNVSKVVEMFEQNGWDYDRFGMVYIGIMEHVELLLPRTNKNER